MKFARSLTITITILFTLILTVSCSKEQSSDVNSTVDINNETVKAALRAHIEFLADDLLRGRDTGTAEYEIAARYVVSNFKQFGLKPAGENGSWLQTVPFTKSTLDTSTVEMIVHTKDSSLDFDFPKQFMSGASAVSEADEVRGKLVFVGYGIVSEELKHDDYSGLNVKGKIVVYLGGKPASFPSEMGAHLASGSEKRRNAAEQGAIGIIAVHTPLSDKVRTYEKSIPNAGKPSMSWQMKEGGVFGNYSEIKGGAYISKEAGKILFSSAGHDLEQIFTEIEADKVPLGFDMDIEVSFKRQSSHENIVSSNVIAMLEGSDPILKNEYVVYSAHLDHIGDTAHGDEEDNINNGALDNASGVAVMLETARRFSQGEPPKRSILFVVVTGEEKGLLGSNYFAHYPTVPVESMVANINLDMPLILYPFADVIAFGAEHSTLAGFVERAAALQGIKLSPDPMPEQALFVRSDHYSFVKQGIPSIFLVPGWTSKDPEINGEEVFGQFFSKHYHQPSDDISLPINYDAGATFIQVNFDIGQEIANSKSRPQWNEGDFFGDKFKK
ncbi:MAG: peptidase M28 [Gammaproteobacteria bacterium]|nr:MAG: peptidase M28 [Gammaproteobacteria bacterium]